MKKVAVFIIVTLLIPTNAVVYSGSSTKDGRLRGVPQGPVAIYDNHRSFDIGMTPSHAGKVEESTGSPPHFNLYFKSPS